MKRSSMWVVAIWVGFVPALLAQSGTRYSQEEAERRLARIQEIAASSEGKIEITVIRSLETDDARNLAALPAESAVAIASAMVPDTSTVSCGSMPAAEASVATQELPPPAVACVPFGAEFTALKDPDTVWQTHFNRALSLQRHGAYREALKILLRLTVVQPDNPRCGECYYQMGECLTALKQHPFAVRAYRQVLRYPECAKYGEALLRAI